MQTKKKTDLVNEVSTELLPVSLVVMQSALKGDLTADLKAVLTAAWLILKLIVFDWLYVNVLQPAHFHDD